MTILRPTFGGGRLRVSRVVYHGDLTDNAAKAIPLGVMTDLNFGNVYGLGLTARTELTPAEAHRIGALIRPQLQNPFAYLDAEFDRVWLACGPDRDAFAELPCTHFTSLRFEELATHDLDVPTAVAADGENIDVQIAWAQEALKVRSSELFWELMRDHWPRMPPLPNGRTQAEPYDAAA